MTQHIDSSQMSTLLVGVPAAEGSDDLPRSGGAGGDLNRLLASTSALRECQDGLPLWSFGLWLIACLRPYATDLEVRVFFPYSCTAEKGVATKT